MGKRSSNFFNQEVTTSRQGKEFDDCETCFCGHFCKSFKEMAAHSECWKIEVFEDDFSDLDDEEAQPEIDEEADLVEDQAEGGVVEDQAEGGVAEDQINEEVEDQAEDQIDEEVDDQAEGGVVDEQAAAVSGIILGD